MAINFPEGTQNLPANIVGFGSFTDTTRRTSLGTGSTYKTLISGTYNKQLSNSKILLIGYSQGWGNESGAVQFRAVAGNREALFGGGYNYSSSGYYGNYFCNALITNNTQTGNITVSYGYYAVGNYSNEKPFTTQNPTSSDDNRISSSGTVLYVFEIE